MYCNGDCEHLNEKKHKCGLTNEKLTYMKRSDFGISFTAHEYKGCCIKDSTHSEEDKPNCLGTIYEKDPDDNLHECIMCWHRVSCIIEAENRC